jgi:hypothetical protein
MIGFLDVFGASATEVGTLRPAFKTHGGGVRFMGYLWKGVIGIEMKSRGESLGRALARLEDCAACLPAEDMPEPLLASDFRTLRLKRNSTGVTREFETSELCGKAELFAGLVERGTREGREAKVLAGAKAAEKTVRLQEALEPRGHGGHPLAVLLVRLLFCMFADDTGLFRQNAFAKYAEASRSDGSDLSSRLGRLFDVLDMPPKVRAGRELLPEELLGFECVSGGLFEEKIEIPEFDGRARRLLLDCASHGWKAVSPAVLGSLYQSVMDRTKRREIGAHYTGEDNILKLIGPLFLHGLRDELGLAGGSRERIESFLAKLGSLRFLDPACGCGNFLIAAYRELRLLEIEALKMIHGQEKNGLGVKLAREVNIEQFSGIELEDFPCRIARAGLRLTERQMSLRASEALGHYHARLPLETGANIVRGNALELDWETALPKPGPTYVLGNPPYSGARIMSAGQKADLRRVFGDIPGLGCLDYVTGWFKKAADYAEGSDVRCAFVATSSLVQGVQPAALWKPLMERGVRINFGVKPFEWPDVGKGKASVNCVIIGFSHAGTGRDLNPYLLEAPSEFLEDRSRPICEAPVMGFGNKPVDGGNYLFTRAQRDEFLRKEPGAAGLFREWAGAKEYLSGEKRYCLWLGNSAPDVLRGLPDVLKRIQAVRDFRLKSKSFSTRRLASAPTRFHVENMPDKESLAVPRVTTSARDYIPIFFLPPSKLAGDILLAPGAGLYHFGILSSGVHMAWVRIIGGRLVKGFRYSIGVVYNNFPWPDPDPRQRKTIEAAAKGVLDARLASPGSTLAALYDPRTMPPRLAAAHRKLDSAVLRAYGLSKEMSDEAVAAHLMTLHHKLTCGNGGKLGIADNNAASKQ